MGNISETKDMWLPWIQSLSPYCADLWRSRRGKCEHFSSLSLIMKVDSHWVFLQSQVPVLIYVFLVTAPLFMRFKSRWSGGEKKNEMFESKIKVILGVLTHSNPVKFTLEKALVMLRNHGRTVQNLPWEMACFIFFCSIPVIQWQLSVHSWVQCKQELPAAWLTFF